jgi:hypothetical protein
MKEAVNPGPTASMGDTLIRSPTPSGPSLSTSVHAG